MKKLSPAKQQQLAVIILATLAVVAVVYLLLIAPQNEQNRKLAAEIKDKQARVQEIRQLVKHADETKVKAEEISAQLNLTEMDIATGDVFAWTYDTIRRFKTGYHLDIPNIAQPTPSEMDLIPNFPYKQIKFAISGTGYYDE